MKIVSLALLTALFWGLAPVLEKIGLSKLSPIAALAFRSVVITGVMVAVALAAGAGKELRVADGRTLLCLALGGIMSGLLGQGLYYIALRLGNVSTVVPIVAAGYPLAAAVFGVSVLKEPLTAAKTIGAALIVAGILTIRAGGIK